MKKLLFVCTGNICRSPTAHALALHHIEKLGLKGFEIDSAGTSSYHCGEKPDSRSVAIGKKRGINFEGIYSRSITKDDFVNFDLIFAMDRGHISSLKQLCPPQFENKIQLFLQYAGVKNNYQDEVIDPYYGSKGFEEVFDLVNEAVESIIKYC
ncbi:MAG: protein-tyrosine phosphatase [Lentimonas sp.]|jgi:protein-tyrosine phosphatase